MSIIKQDYGELGGGISYEESIVFEIGISNYGYIRPHIDIDGVSEQKDPVWFYGSRVDNTTTYDKIEIVIETNQAIQIINNSNQRMMYGGKICEHGEVVLDMPNGFAAHSGYHPIIVLD